MRTEWKLRLAAATAEIKFQLDGSEITFKVETPASDD